MTPEEHAIQDALTEKEIAQKRATLVERARVAKAEHDRAGRGGIETALWVKAAMNLAAFIVFHEGIPDE